MLDDKLFVFDMAQGSNHQQVFSTGQFLIDGGKLPRQTDFLANRCWIFGQVDPVDPRGSLIKRQDSGQNFD